MAAARRETQQNLFMEIHDSGPTLCFWVERPHAGRVKYLLAEPAAMTDVRPLAADAVVVIDDEVLLLKRDHEPYEGTWVLPGGLVEPDETAREACLRETAEEVGLDVRLVSEVGRYDEPGRDPRDIVSVAFRCVPADPSDDPEPREEAREVATFAPETLPEMGFDHERIVRDAT